MLSRPLSLFAYFIATIMVGAYAVHAEPIVAQDYSIALPSLNWVRLPGAEFCISPRELGRRVEERLGREIFFSSAAADVAIEGHIGPRRKKGWLVLLVISDSDGKILGSRTLETEETDCRTLDEALELVIAVSIYPQSGLVSNAIVLPPDLLARLDLLFENEATEPTTESDTSDDEAKDNAAREEIERLTEPQAEQNPRSEYVRRTHWKDADSEDTPSVELNREAQGWAISAVSGMGLGMVADVSFGVGMVVGLQLPGWRPLDVRLNYWFGAEHGESLDLSGSAQPKAWIDVSMLTTNFGLCPVDFGRPETNLRWCIGLGAGSMFASAISDNVIEGPMSLFGDAYTGINLNVVAIDPLALWFGATLELPFSRAEARYHVLSTNDVVTTTQSIRTERIMGKIEIGLSAYFF